MDNVWENSNGIQISMIISEKLIYFEYESSDLNYQTATFSDKSQVDKSKIYKYMTAEC